MSPALSIAMLPIQRCFASGAKVPCWKMLHEEDDVWRSSYQRMPACPSVSLTSTVWFASRVSWPPMFR